MNIWVLGKLGPSVVTAGLVCACAADAQATNTSAAPNALHNSLQNPLVLTGISVLPGFDICFVQSSTMGGFVAAAGISTGNSREARGEALHASPQRVMYLYYLTVRVRIALELMLCRSRV